MTDERETPQPPRPDLLHDRLLDASRLTEDEHWGEAFELLLELEKDYPEDPTLLCMMGVVAGEVEARGMAYDYFRRSLAAEPQDPHVLVALGAGLAGYDDPEAERVLRLAAITAPHLGVARLQYGAYLAREGIFDLALVELNAAREIDPDDARVERELGVAYLLSGAQEEGVARLERAATLATEDVDLQLLYGLALLQARELELGADEVVRAAMEVPHDPDVQLIAALAAATQGWDDEAWNALARAEVAPLPPDPALLREVEEALEADPPAAERLLLEQLIAPLLHDRLLERA